MAVAAAMKPLLGDGIYLVRCRIVRPSNECGYGAGVFDGSYKGMVRCCVLALATAALAGCCAMPWSFAREGGEGDPGFAVMERCYPLELKAARASFDKPIEWTSTIGRRQAKAFYRLFEKVEAGETLTEQDYTAAGCRQYSALPE